MCKRPRIDWIRLMDEPKKKVDQFISPHSPFARPFANISQEIPQLVSLFSSQDCLQWFMIVRHLDARFNKKALVKYNKNTCKSIVG